MRTLWGRIFPLLFLTAGTAAGSVTLVGSPSHGHATATSLTISHTNSGDYLVVAVFNHSYPEATAVTYNGVSHDTAECRRPHRADRDGHSIRARRARLRYSRYRGYGRRELSVFLCGRAVRSSGVHQTRPFRPGGGDYRAFLTAPFTYTVPSETGWMVLDALWTDANHGGSIAPSGDNTLVVFRAQRLRHGHVLRPRSCDRHDGVDVARYPSRLSIPSFSCARPRTTRRT